MDAAEGFPGPLAEDMVHVPAGGLQGLGIGQNNLPMTVQDHKHHRDGIQGLRNEMAAEQGILHLNLLEGIPFERSQAC